MWAVTNPTATDFHLKLTRLVGLGIGERARGKEGRGEEEPTQAEDRHVHGLLEKGGRCS